jgi:hypothetical protein
MDFLEKSFGQASETSKLLITLSTAVTAFCATVVNVKTVETTLLTPATLCQKWLLAISWVALLVCTGIGVWTQLAIADVLSSGTPEKPTSAWNRKITVPFRLQIVTFVLGMAFLVLYGVLRLFG